MRNRGWFEVRRRTWAAVVVAGIAGLAAGLYGWKAYQADWARRHPEAARIARYERIFDVAWKTVDEKYYDPKFDHARWRKIRDAYRPLVKAQPFEIALYINVLDNMLRQAGTSHVSVLPPPTPVITSNGGQVATAPRPKNESCLDAPNRSDFGFHFTEVRRRGGSFMLVDAVRRGSSAERLGIAPGDGLQKLATTNSRDGCPHATVILSRGGSSRQVEFDLERGERPAPQARADLPSGVRVLRFDAFDKASVAWLARNLADPPPRGMILDLRSNSGGLVTAQVEISSYFLEPGTNLGRSVARHSTRSSVTRQSSMRYDGPLVVLIGPTSASAAEITAYALRYHHRGRLVGAETAGAVLAARSYPLPGGGFVDVAVADYLTPDGRRLEGVGVKPDLPVAQTLEAVRAGRDLPLEAAERALLEGRWRP